MAIDRKERGKALDILKTIAELGERLFDRSAKRLSAKAMPDKVVEDKWIPFYCLQCGMGPCPARGHTVNGVLVKVEGNTGFKDEWPCPSMVCAMSYGVMQKIYNPYRIKSPMKRTNQKKGPNEDPRFVEIDWDEAFDTLTNKLKEIKEKGVVDERGLPRVGATQGPPMSTGYAGHGWGPFWGAWGPTERFGGGSGVKCIQTSHVIGEFWNRTFTQCADFKYCNFTILFGRNIAQNTDPGGAAIFTGHADAKGRGMKEIYIGPTLNATAGGADEWIPIKVKTDAAFMFSMLNVILHELDWRKVCDIEFLKKMTNSPYLIGPHGYYLRDPETKKPLVWDPSVPGAKGIHEAQDFALEGTYTVSGIEIGPDGDTYSVVEGTPSFQLLVEHVKDYTPEWASAITDIPAETIRRITREFVEHAAVGATIKIEGVELPLRPVAIEAGRGVCNGWGAYQVVWLQYVLQMLFGALHVPGATVRTRTQMQAGVPFAPDEDGFLRAHAYPTDKENWEWPPKTRQGLRTLTPFSGTNPQGEMGARHLAWKSITEPPEKWPLSVPDIYVFYRNNPVSSQYDSNRVRMAFEKLPFTVNFAYTINESSWYADLLLPENTDLESYQLQKVGWKDVGANWGFEYIGYFIRQPVLKSLYNTRDLTDIFTELADRLGFLSAYNQNINKINQLKEHLALSPDRKYSSEEITDRLCQSVTGGEHGLEWFKQTGGILWPQSKLTWYLHLDMMEKGIRYELPYQGRLNIIGEQLKRRLHEVGIEWWNHQADTIAQPLPCWEDFPSIFENVYQAGSEYDLWVTSHRASVFAGQQNFEVPWNLEIASDFLDVPVVLINPVTARRKGINSGDSVCLESVFGKTYANALLSETVRPEVLSVGGFGTYISPVSKEYKWANPSEIQGIDVRFMDEAGGSSDQVIVKIYKVKG
jgi:phenylacetyl-CoA:acceptor oxidoreductase